jgi:hypothetical protein
LGYDRSWEFQHHQCRPRPPKAFGAVDGRRHQSHAITQSAMKIRAILESDRDWAAALIAQHFRTPEIISRGVRHDTRSLPGLVVEQGGERLGLLHYCILGRRCEVVALVAIRQRQWLTAQVVVAYGSSPRTTTVPHSSSTTCSAGGRSRFMKALSPSRGA